MSEIFHKSCYTSRSSGYKYRTLSTNTGERKRRDSKEDNTFDKKFREIEREIMTRIDTQVYLTQKSRDAIEEKINKIDAKISSILELQKNVHELCKSLQVAEVSLSEMLTKVDKIEAVVGVSEESSLQSKRSTNVDPIFEEKELFASSVITQV